MNLTTANIPMKTVGPIKIIGHQVCDLVQVPLATYESPVWPSVARGAKVSMQAGGIFAIALSQQMTRSIILAGKDALIAAAHSQKIQSDEETIKAVIKTTSRFANLKSMHIEQVGPLLYIRISITSGDASGHNMVTKAADAVISYLLEKHEALEYVSLSGNYCTDKKASAVNGILGRGISVVADIKIDRHICASILRTTPEKIVDLNIKKNFIGSSLAGSIRSSNAHFANILLAIYLATGQDAANIIEGSQGITFAEMQEDDLYFSVSLPNIILGAVGSGKDLGFTHDNLTELGCTGEKEAGTHARRLAIITAAAVLCGELSLLAALTNPKELMRSHQLIERKQKG